MKVPISIAAIEPMVGAASVVLIYNGQREWILVPRLNLELVSAPLIEVKEKDASP